ncbi:MAG: hypothetical protein AAB464_00285, partial [Patescibacteria group bacterium]
FSGFLTKSKNSVKFISMILASHIIAASAIAAPLALKPLTISNSAAIFLVSFLSHYLLDLIPHWDYELSLFDEKNRKFTLKDLIKISIDLFLGMAMGMAIGFLILGLPVSFEGFFTIGLIVFASCLPDILQIGYISWGKFPFVQLQKFHSVFHAKLKLNNQPIKGIAIQAIVLFILIILFI